VLLGETELIKGDGEQMPHDEQTSTMQYDKQTKARRPCSRGKDRAGRGRHLRFNSWLESRSCQENHYGRQAIHETPILAVDARRRSPRYYDATGYFITGCHGNVKPYSRVKTGNSVEVNHQALRQAQNENT